MTHTHRRRSFVTSIARAAELPGYTAQLKEVDAVPDALSAGGFELGDAILDAVSDALIEIVREGDIDRAELEQGHAA